MARPDGAEGRRARGASRVKSAASPWPAPASGDAAATAGAPPADPRLACIVSHTHWDREWYLPFRRFRVHLAAVVRQVLDALEKGGEFRHFLLDGQAIVLEDHLAIQPEDEERIRTLVREGKLSIGPWYVLPDWFLVSGEAIVRNLLVGHEACGRFGPVQKVGYMPDSFGHVAQIPQILRRAGIESFIYTRGNDDAADACGGEYRWEAPDGSDVLAVNQHRGYDAAAGLGFDSYWAAHTRRAVRPELAVEKVRALFEGMAARSRGDVRLLCNGGDHLPPQQDFDAVIGALRAAFPRTEFRHTGLAEFVEAVQQAGTATARYRGELRGGKDQFILPGVWSARTYLKQMNDEAENLLERYAEPVSAYLHFRHGKAYPAGALADAWRLLLQNHPHDSICGCSTDEVHREMVPRFAGVVDTAEQVLTDQMVDLAPTFAADPAGDAAIVLAVMNPLPVVRSEVVERLVVVGPPGVDIERLELVDGAGRPVPFAVTRSWWVERFWGMDYRTAPWGERQGAVFASYREEFAKRILRRGPGGGKNDRFLEIRFLARDLPALGHAIYRLRQRAAGSLAAHGAPPTAHGVPLTADRTPLTAGGGRLTATEGPLTADGRRLTASLENLLVLVSLHANGTFDVTYKATGRTFEALNLLTDTEDVGDEYDYSPASESETVTAAGSPGEVRVVEAGGLLGRLETSFAFRLPESIGKGRRRRARRKVDCPVTVRLTLREGSPLVEVETVVENRARDHRLRALFAAGAATDTVVSDGHFYLNRRPVDVPPHADWLQPPADTHPQREFSLVEDARGGLAVLARGLREIAPVRSAEGRAGFAVTLLRAVGWLSRDDLPTRRMRNAGPTLATPDAQCLGTQRFRYAVLPYAGEFLAAGVKTWSERWRTPPLVVQGVDDGHLSGGEGLFALEGEGVHVTAIKKHESRDTLVVRLFNLADVRREATLCFGPPVAGAWRADLLEKRLCDLMMAGGHDVVAALGPHEIATLEIEFGG
jgi:alpha-mannosidase